MSEIRRLTQRIGQAKRNGVAELAERLRISRAELAVRLAREYDVWLLVNAQGNTEFVDSRTWKSRIDSWKERKRASTSTPTALAEPASAEGAAQPPAAPSDPVREFFGEPISVYTRAQALEDGVLVDVTPWASGCFKYPVALTAALWTIVSDLAPGTGGDRQVDERVREMLRAAAQVAVDSSRGSSQFTFPILMGTTEGIRTLELLAHCGPGDQGEPVITIGFPSDF
jgi:hypothetical protein